MRKSFASVMAGAMALSMIASATSCAGSKKGGSDPQTADKVDEVIVVAYGTAKKSAYTGSASVVKIGRAHV